MTGQTLREAYKQIYRYTDIWTSSGFSDVVLVGSDGQRRAVTKFAIPHWKNPRTEVYITQFIETTPDGGRRTLTNMDVHCILRERKKVKELTAENVMRMLTEGPREDLFYFGVTAEQFSGMIDRIKEVMVDVDDYPDESMLPQWLKDERARRK